MAKKSSTGGASAGKGDRKSGVKKPTTRKKAERSAKTKAAANKTAKKKAAKTRPANKPAKKTTKKKTTGTKKKATTNKASTSRPAGKKTTKPTAPNKKSAAKPASNGKPVQSASSADYPDRPLNIKTHLSRKELVYYKKLLLAKRIELLGDMASMSEEALNSESTDLSHVPLHMADMGSENHDRELMLGLAESERKTVRQIEQALVRIAEGTYGVCEVTGKRITKARLEAKPWARYCIEVARDIERRGGGA